MVELLRSLSEIVVPVFDIGFNMATSVMLSVSVPSKTLSEEIVSAEFPLIKNLTESALLNDGLVMVALLTPNLYEFGPLTPELWVEV